MANRTQPPGKTIPVTVADRTPDYAGRHVRFGWWSLLFFAAFGFALELLHGFKVSAYVDAASETRRLTWTLAHAHGTLLSLVNVVFGVMMRATPEFGPRDPRLVSLSLIVATIALPVGFALGGVVVYGGDPGLGVLLVPVGAGFLLATIFFIAKRQRTARA